MPRLSMLLFVVAAGCGGKSSPSPVAPRPAPGQAEPAAPTLPPIQAVLPGSRVSVKLVSPGEGRRASLRYRAKARFREQLEIEMDFAAKQTEPGSPPQDQIVPTIVLVGEAETKSVRKGGNAAFTLTVRSTAARAVAGAQLPAKKLQVVLGGLAGMTMSSTLGTNGAAGATIVRIEKPTALSPGALELIRLMLPTVPVLPSGAVGVGARWQATTTTKLADKLDVTLVTDYVLVAHAGTTWKIKGKTTLTGAAQTTEGGTISGIKGAGTIEATLADGTLFPVCKSQLETEFTATEGDKSSQFALKIGTAITPIKKVYAW